MIGRVPRRTLSARAARFAKHRLETKPLALGGQLVDNFGNGGQLVGLLVVGARALLSPFKPLHLHFRSQRPAQKKYLCPPLALCVCLYQFILQWGQNALLAHESHWQPPMHAF